MSSKQLLPLCVLVTCYNRVAITLPNLVRLCNALDEADQPYSLFVLDDASPDGTGDAIRERLPHATVVTSEGNLFWNRGMRRILTVAREGGKHFSGYLIFNDDVRVFANAVADTIGVWRRLNVERPTTIATATHATDNLRTTYSGYRLKNRYHPMAVRMIDPDGNLQPVDTFNGNFVLIPRSTMEAIDPFDPVYWHSFGDIDLGLAIRARGEPVLLAPYPIGECDDRGAQGARSRHGMMVRIRKGFTGLENPRQNMHLILKFAPSRIIGIGIIGRMLTKRLWMLIVNDPHVMPGSPDAKPSQGLPH